MTATAIRLWGWKDREACKKHKSSFVLTSASSQVQSQTAARPLWIPIMIAPFLWQKTIKSTQIWENQAHRLETVVLLAWNKFDHITNRTSSNIWKLGSKSLRSLMIHMQAALHWPPSGSADWSKQTWEPLQPAAVRIDPRSTIECSPRSTACHPPWVRPTLFHPWCTTPLPALQRADGHWLVVRRSQDPCRRCSRARRCHQS